MRIPGYFPVSGFISRFSANRIPGLRSRKTGRKLLKYIDLSTVGRSILGFFSRLFPEKPGNAGQPAPRRSSGRRGRAPTIGPRGTF
jgi:hypothetical protein